MASRLPAPGGADWGSLTVEIRCRCGHYVVAYSDGYDSRPCPGCGKRWRIHLEPYAAGVRVWVSAVTEVQR